VNGKEVKEFIKKEKYLIIIDIRTAMEVRVGKISEDNHIDFYDLSFQDKIDKEKN
jgi:predicted sulfurtransferase